MIYYIGLNIYDWVFGEWLSPAIKLAGFNSDHISHIYSKRMVAVYFNMKWIQKMPKELCNM